MRKLKTGHSSWKVIVQSESSDWYIIPEDYVEEWDAIHAFADNMPQWAQYVDSPSHVSFKTYEVN